MKKIRGEAKRLRRTVPCLALVAAFGAAGFLPGTAAAQQTHQAASWQEVADAMASVNDGSTVSIALEADVSQKTLAVATFPNGGDEWESLYGDENVSYLDGQGHRISGAQLNGPFLSGSNYSRAIVENLVIANNVLNANGDSDTGLIETGTRSVVTLRHVTLANNAVNGAMAHLATGFELHGEDLDVASNMADSAGSPLLAASVVSVGNSRFAGNTADAIVSGDRAVFLYGTNAFKYNRTAAGQAATDIHSGGPLYLGYRDYGYVHDYTYIGSGISAGSVSLEEGTLELASEARMSAKQIMVQKDSTTRVSVSEANVVKNGTAATYDEVGNDPVKAAIGAGGYAIYARDSLVIDEGARLVVEGAKANTTYLVAYSNYSLEGSGWSGANLSSTTPLVRLTRVDTSMENQDSDRLTLGEERLDTRSNQPYVLVSAEGVDAREALPCVDIPNIINAQVAGPGLNTVSGLPSAVFLSRATDSRYLPGGTKQMEMVINSASQLATAGGVKNMTHAGSDLFNKAIIQHSSIAGTLQHDDTKEEAEKDGPRKDLWVDILWMHGRNKGAPICSGRECGEDTKIGLRMDMGAVIVGLDRSYDENRYYGVSLMGGKGSASSQGSFSHTKNDVDFWGASLYSGYKKDNWNLFANVSYSNFDNDVRQSLPTSMQMGSHLKADVKSHQWSAGVRGEYRWQVNDSLDFLPHAGLRYDRISTSGFKTRVDAGDVFSTRHDSQNIYSLPIGITAKGSYKTSSEWTFQPTADFTMIFARGDLDDDTRVRAVGLNATDAMSTRIVDATSYSVAIGLDMVKKDKSFGLEYNAQTSSHQMFQGLMLKFAYQFR